MRALVLLCHLISVSAAFAEVRVPREIGAASQMPTIAATQVPTPPSIDGRLDEAVWALANVTGGFIVSDQKRPASEHTEVLVLVDKSGLYFGFRVFDSQPSRIDAQQTRRDGGLAFDDHVSVELDTYGNARDISRFHVNSIGTQRDEFVGGRARSTAWRGDWTAAVAQTDYGWSAEIAIPFAMLNYPAGAESFRVNFVRYHNRTGERSYWSDVTPLFRPEAMGLLAGLTPPPEPSNAWAVMPYLLIAQNTPDKRGEVRHRQVAAGVDLRYRPTPQLTGLAALNPDFSQVETQFASINFSYTEKQITEVRPFFIEGYNYLDAGRRNLYLYTKRLPNFDAGGKGFGRIGSTQLGAFAITAPDSRRDYGARFLRELGPTNSASLSLYGTERRDFSNNVLVTQVAGRQASGLNYAFDLARSATHGRTGGDGSHGRALVGWDWDHWFVGTTVDRYDVGFFPANGLLPRDLPGTRGTSAYGGYYRVFGTGALHSARADVTWTARETLDGDLQQRSIYAGGFLEFANEVRSSLYHFTGDYRPGTGVPGMFSGESNDDRYWTIALDLNTRSSRIGYGVAYSHGSLGGAAYRYLPLYVWFRPRPDVYLSLASEFLKSFGTSDQSILTAKWDVTSNDAIGVRLARSSGEKYFRLSYGRQVRSGVDVLAVIDKQPQSAAQFSLKLLFTFL